MQDMQSQLINLGQCSIADITLLWNTGFEQYVNDMTRTVFQTSVRMGRHHIHPELSVAAYVNGTPAGFVMIGWKEVNGQKLAWNGGTGVNPAFRGRGLSKALLAEAIRNVREHGASSLSLETRTDNDRAIAAYRRSGFEIVDKLLVLRRSGAFHDIPFRREANAAFVAIRGMPELVGQLPFYCRQATSWTTQWFCQDAGQALIAYDRQGRAAGYALFQEEFANAAHQSAVRLYHCEADPARDDASEVIRYMLAEIMQPCAAGMTRIAHYVRASNRELIGALQQAGFEQTYEEYLMTLAFPEPEDR